MIRENVAGYWFGIPTAFDTPPGEYWVLMEMYTYPEGARASVLDEQRQPVSDALRLGFIFPFSTH